MKKITNEAGLPEALVKAVENDGYSKGDSDYSTTELSKPSRIVALEKIHADELTEDVADRIYALIGKLGHSILEHAGTADIIEKRLFWKIGGKTISGQVDVVDGSILEDWKFCSIYTAKEGVKPEWTAQASVNRFLCRKNGINITEARYIALYRDWSKPASLRDKDYPKHQVQVFSIPLWTMEQTEKWIEERIKSHEDAMLLLPLCSDEERWAKPPRFALMKKGRKKAVKLYDVEAWARRDAEGDPALSVEYRPSESVRCQHYCGVSEFCQQWKTIQASQQAEVDNLSANE
jgi:hypothetical protein